MYNNTGSKIKNKATTMCGVKIFFNIVIAVCFLLAFFALATIKLSEWPEFLPPWSPFILLILVAYFGIYRPIAAWNQYLLIAGYGELIEETTKAATQLEEIKEILIQKNKEQ